jgi:hypothetical protein
MEEKDMSKSNSNGSDGGSQAYRQLVQDVKEDSEANYKKIQEIVNQYQFKDSAVRRIALKMLAATKRQIARYDRELKALDAAASSSRTDNNNKGKGKRRK